MFDEDLIQFFDDDEHADVFIIQKNGEVFRGIFDNEYTSPEDISGTSPAITCPTICVKDLNRGDIIERGNELYIFILQEPDGTGVSTVKLEENA